MLRKLCFREIRNSFGRFFAIAAIIALGVGFFAGLRVSKQAMVATGEQYLRDFQLYDFRLISTLGLTDADVAAVSALEDVQTSRGSISQDVLYANGAGSDSVIAMHTLLPDINVPHLRAGRMPQAPDECIVDANAFSADSIGTTIQLSSNNPDDILEVFADRSYTIVGLADSPAYINFERGSTNLGSGSVSCFGYLLPEGFAADYYTEIYLTLTQTAPIYSDDYTKLTDAAKPHLETVLSNRAEIRYTDLQREGKEKLDDGRAELAQARLDYADGQREADEKLADAQKKLLDARAELDDGWISLSDAQRELEEEVSKAESEIQDGQQELADALAALEDGELQYMDSGKELEDGEVEYNDGLQAYRDGLAEYEDGKLRYENGLASYEAGLKEYEDGQNSYMSGRLQYKNGLAQYEAGLEEYQATGVYLDQLKIQLDSAPQELEKKHEELEAAQASMDFLIECLLSMLTDGDNQPLFDSADSLLAAISSDEAVALQVTNLLYAMSDTVPGAPADAAALLASCNALSDGWAAYENAVAAYPGQVEAYQQARAEWEAYGPVLAASKQELDHAANQLDFARAELDQARRELADAKRELEDAEKELNNAWAELEDGRSELEDARTELDDGWAQYHDARAELDDGWAEYQKGKQELADARTKLADETTKAQSEILDARMKLEDGELEYKDGITEYEEARLEADQALKDAAQKIADGEQALADGKRELAELEPAACYTLGRETNVGYVCFESDTNIVAAVSKVFPLFFFLVAALVCITTMTRMVEDERTKIGVLKAIGYSDYAIMMKYLMYAGSASLLGCIAGFLIGSWAFPLVMWKVYAIMYSFSYPIAFVLDWKLAGFSIGLYLLCALGSTWLVCRSSLREAAAELIRPKAPKSGKRIFLEYIPILWKRMKFLYKVSARNIFRYKKRFFMMILGIGGCTALLLTGFGIRDSIANIVDYQYSEISLYDSSITFKNAMSERDQETFTEACSQWVASAVFFHGSSMDASFGSTSKSVNFVVSDRSMTEFMNFHQNDCPIPYPDDGEVLINNGLASALGVQVGDQITLRDSDMDTLSVTVSGIFDNYVYNYAFVTPGTVTMQWGAMPEIKSAYFIDADGVDPHAAGAAVLDQAEVSSVSVNADLQARVNAMLKSLDYIVLLVIVCAGSLAFIVLYNLTNINIMERIREIATIKVLGFYANETSAYVFRENTVLTAIGAVAGILLGKLLHAYVMTQIKIDMMHFDIRISGISYILALILTFLFSAVVNFVMFFKLEKIDMAESLKSIE